MAIVPEDAGTRAIAFEECTGFTIEWEEAVRGKT